MESILPPARLAADGFVEKKQLEQKRVYEVCVVEAEWFCALKTECENW